MSWVKLDDGFAEHPKIAKVGAFGAWLQVLALCYANRNGTDGFIPEAVAQAFVGHGVTSRDTDGASWTLGLTSGMRGRDLGEVDWPARMVAAGIWEIAPDGYLIHDYEQYQPSKEDREHAREQWRSRQQRHRARAKPGESPGVSRRDASVTHGVTPGTGTGEDLLGQNKEPRTPAQPSTKPDPLAPTPAGDDSARASSRYPGPSGEDESPSTPPLTLIPFSPAEPSRPRRRPVARDGSDARAGRRPMRMKPDDVVLTPAREAAARAEGVPESEIAREWMKFSDHTFRTGRNNWDATWKNWVREAVDRMRFRPRGGGNPKTAGNLAAAADFIRRGRP